jgi:hypothetical protein
MIGPKLVGGLHPDMPEAVYHADPVPASQGGSLSSSGAKLLLPPGCPALFDHARRHPGGHKDAFDLGHATHTHILGAGAEIVTVDAPDWRSAQARAAKAKAHAEGKTPLLAGQASQVEAMTAAVRAHPVAGPLLAPGAGEPEVSAFAQDHGAGGVWLRARFDWLTTIAGGRPAIVDLKTTADTANPDTWGKTVDNLAYHLQAAHYLRVARLLGMDDPAWIWVVVSKQPPHLIHVSYPDQDMLAAGAAASRAAINLFAECTSRDEWPGWAPVLHETSLPAWSRTRIPETESE